MIKIDLITGFLGAGKTTFIKKYAKHLMDQGMKIGIIENDFGAVNVDMMLFQDIIGEQCDIEMISGGCDKDCHYRRFKTKLIAMGMTGYDRVIVEPSGIFDADEFFDLIHESPIDRWFEIGSILSVVDAKLDPSLSRRSKYLLTTQTANAGKIIVSKLNLANEVDVQQTIGLIHEAMEQFLCKRRIDDIVLAKDWDELSDADYKEIMSAGYKSESYQKLWFDENENYKSVYLMNRVLTPDQLRKIVQKLFEDEMCGNIFRIKGFLRIGEDEWLELNATKNEFLLEPIQKGQDIIVVIGEGLNEERVCSYWPDEVESNE